MGTKQFLIFQETKDEGHAADTAFVLFTRHSHPTHLAIFN